MIDKIKAASAVLLVIALVDGVVNIIEWLGGFDLFAASATVGLVLLLLAMLFDKTNFGEKEQGFFIVGFAHLCQLYHDLCGSGPEDEDTDALADAIVADALAEVEEKESCRQ